MTKGMEQRERNDCNLTTAIIAWRAMHPKNGHNDEERKIGNEMKSHIIIVRSQQWIAHYDCKTSLISISHSAFSP